VGVIAMGLDVGVVKITYLDRPAEPMYDFLLALAAGELDEDWGGGWSGNAIVEFMKGSLVEQAKDWADSKGFSPEKQNELRQWVEELPWDGDNIVLHLNW
jgi:hypothetical protein